MAEGQQEEKKQKTTGEEQEQGQEQDQNVTASSQANKEKPFGVLLVAFYVITIVILLSLITEGFFDFKSISSLVSQFVIGISMGAVLGAVFFFFIGTPIHKTEEVYNFLKVSVGLLVTTVVFASVLWLDTKIISANFGTTTTTLSFFCAMATVAYYRRETLLSMCIAAGTVLAHGAWYIVLFNQPENLKIALSFYATFFNLFGG